MDGCELPHGCWELSLGPLQEQQMPLTTEIKGVHQGTFLLHSFPLIRWVAHPGP